MSDHTKDKAGLDEGSHMPFLDHLDQLRWRLLKSILGVIVMTILALVFSDELFQLLVKPLGNTKLHVTDVTGSFYAYMKVSLIAGVFAATPIIFYQLWAFISPGLYAKEKAAILPMVIMSTLLFMIGAAFCWIVVLPLSLAFLIGFAGDLFEPIITVGSYISFAGTLLIAFGFSFEMPVLAYFLGRVGLLKSGFMARGRRYSIVIILIISAVLTPADVFSQVALAIPLYFLYEISIIIVRSQEKKRAARQKEREAEYADDFPMN